MTLLLALETAGPLASVALLRGGEVLGEMMIRDTRAHSETLLPLAEQVLSALHYMPGDIDAIAVDNGPGSFTGVRIGVCAANAMAAALGIPVVGISSLQVLVQQYLTLRCPLCALIDARDGRAYGALFQRETILLEPAAVDIDAFLPQLPPNALFVGDGAQAYAENIHRFHADALIAPKACCLLRASDVGIAAYTILQSGTALPAEVLPNYLRPTQAERMAGASQETAKQESTQGGTTRHGS